jgi:hypothetical protein
MKLNSFVYYLYLLFFNCLKKFGHILHHFVKVFIQYLSYFFHKGLIANVD